MQKEVIVTGVKHYKGISAFDIDMKVVVEFDGQNPYSHNAFKVLDGVNIQLGSIAENPSYIPRKICSDITILAKELKQLVNDGFTIVGAVVKDIVRNYAILTVELKEPKTKEEDVVLPIEAKKSLYTVVGTKYHSTNANVGDIVRFRVVKGTTTLFNENNEPLGVLPQSDKKIKELQEIEAPIVLNRVARTDFNTLENVFVVSHIVEDKYIFLRELEEEDLKEENGDETMVKTELKDVNVVVECGEPQFAIGTDKIIEYDEITVCGSCGAPIEENFKFCSQCGKRVREEITSSQPSNNGDETMILKDLLKEEFESATISGKASDIAKPLNIFSRNVKAITNDCPTERMAIMSGNRGKFVWMQYHDPNNPLGDGGIASGSIEDMPIHYNGNFYDDINYSKIAFALIPVDDF